MTPEKEAAIRDSAKSYNDTYLRWERLGMMNTPVDPAERLLAQEEYQLAMAQLMEAQKMLELARAMPE